MRLTLGPIIDSTNASLCIDEEDIITVHCENARAVAEQIARAVNRDKIFDALVAALSPFRSDEMGGKLVTMIDIREDGGEEAEKRLRRLVTMIDVILNTVEAADDEAYAA
ncbi:hypothetical protein BSZ19_21835 [Bradyrhizobium japonicum]|uniref:Uncharacterized protein n=1 Tax=Bradyrhizobium japonicum TaxID=375 RepID=A0A1Y2JM25_BRAJP|nr:hypothetical protein [Bradyrhizobium japonicum]OSJ31528.1 hypothetical protein BSZ19_21835 [Bradyrhizobium japonicum]